MGGDIAAWCVVQGMQASLQDLDEAQIAKALARAKGLFKRQLRTPLAVETAVARLIADPSGKHIKHADVVIEAIVEKLDVKQSLFRKLEHEVKPGAVLATNTSSLRLEDIAKPLADPGRLVGLHFFNPVAQLPLVEVVRGEPTREEEVRKACAFVTAINKLPLIVKSCPGFLVNRVLAPYMMEAVRRYQLGEPREKIDQAALKFGMPMGPLELMDMVGLDIANHVGEELDLAPGGDNVLAALVKQGKLGKKTGEGFYVWEQGKPKREQVAYDQAELERLGRELVKPMLDEAERALADRVVATRRSCRCRRDLRHGLRAVPRRSAPLPAQARARGGDRRRGLEQERGAERDDMAEASMRRVAVLGGSRIPFCRSHTAYAELSNLDMLIAALGGLVDRFALHGAHIDEVVGGAVVTHAKDWNLAREAVIGSALAPTTPGITMMQACGTSLPRRARARRQDRHRADRIGHRLRLRHDERRAGRVPAASSPSAW